MDFMKSKQGSKNNPLTYSSALIEEKTTKVFDQNDKKEVILLLEYNDLRWKHDPWQLMARVSRISAFLPYHYQKKWGMNPLNERDYIHLEQKVTVKYNYWDYINSFNKTLLYENTNRKHSWFINICSNIFTQPIPNWFCKWWTLYGPSIKNLPDQYKSLYA
ncbi:hypothetical protein H5410_057119 [Solanum commersonii]|uniref:Uncharacterized protein n=1 Tax=Solanum commersonii TaxID=4109 RepID=A0A9J5WM50_SOLCO|nr:hypothetical protein H5410_057119 [Solanum commersonii]